MFASGPTSDEGSGGGTVERRAQLLDVPAPEYTDEAREGRVTGEVILEVRLTAAGVVHVLRVLSGLGYGLDESAVAAVRRSRCRPALRNGRPIDATGTVTVVFSLT